jgi:hypothetical protein
MNKKEAIKQTLKENHRHLLHARSRTSTRLSITTNDIPRLLDQSRKEQYKISGSNAYQIRNKLLKMPGT